MSGNPGARWDAFWWIAGIVLVLVTSLSLAWCYWEELRGDQESLSTTVRNVGLVIGGAVAILFAVWRSIVAEKQAATAQSGLLNERYQKGAEMLGSKELPVRLGGIYALARLARDHPDDYHTQIMRLLCAFVRHPAGDSIESTLLKKLTPDAKFTSGFDGEAGEDAAVNRPPRVREDVQAVMTVIGGRSEDQIKTEKRENYRLDLVNVHLNFVRLVDADLNGVNLPDAELTNAGLIGAKLKGAWLRGSNFENATLFRADLGGVRLSRVNLEHANLVNANLTGTVMRRCEGLTQAQLNEAVADLDHPPDLTGSVDADTGEPLVWRGGTPNG